MTTNVHRVPPGGDGSIIMGGWIGSRAEPRRALLSSGRVRNSVVLGRKRVVQPDEQLIVGMQGPATLRLAEPQRTAAASIRIDEFLTARASPVGGHAVLHNTRSSPYASHCEKCGPL